MPSDLKPTRLEVCFEPFFLKVVDKISGEIFLQGRLERGIVPKECLWMLDSGTGEDGCLLLLHKMNLELFQRQGQKTIRKTCTWSTALHLELAPEDVSRLILIQGFAKLHALGVEDSLHRTYAMKHAPDAFES